MYRNAGFRYVLARRVAMLVDHVNALHERRREDDAHWRNNDLGRQREIKRLEDEITIRDRQIKQLLEINERDRERVKAETSYFIRKGIENQSGKNPACPTCGRPI
jgi:hypothetical protein